MADTVWIAGAHMGNDHDPQMICVGTTAKAAQAALDAWMQERWQEAVADGELCDLEDFRDSFTFEEPEEFQLHKEKAT